MKRLIIEANSAKNERAEREDSTRKVLLLFTVLETGGEVNVSYGASMIQHLWPMILYLTLLIGLIAMMLIGPYFLGHRRSARATGEPYECGIVPVGSAQYRVPIPFYLFAIFFVIFDLEAVFLFVWAISVRESGWAGFIEAFIFISILLVALFYLWRLGALDWRTQRQKLDRAKVVQPR